MTNGRDTTGWAVGFTLFAAIMMLMAGAWQALAGLVAIFQNEFYVQTRSYLYEFDATTWGWIHLVVGLIVAFAGWGLLSGRTWARLVGITVAALSATANFLFIPYYSFWSMVIIAVDIFVIWALAAHGREYKEMKDAEAEYRMHRQRQSAIALLVFTLVTAAHFRVRARDGSEHPDLSVAITSTVVLLLTFAFTTLVDEPATAVALAVILLLSVALDIGWKRIRDSRIRLDEADATTRADIREERP